MAFSYTLNNNGKAEHLGTRKMLTGTFTSAGGSTGGTIKTGLRRVEFFSLQAQAAAVVANAPVVNGTLPLSTGDVVVVTDANVVGSWVAIGTE